MEAHEQSQGANGTVEHAAPATQIEKPWPAHLYAGLVRAQQAIQAVAHDKVAKTEKFSYPYTTSESVIAEGRAALHGAGLGLFPWEVKVLPQDENGLPDLEAAEGWLLIVYRLFSLFTTDYIDFPPDPVPWMLDRGRPRDKAIASAKTYSMGYFMRGLLLIPRPDKASVDERNDDNYEPRRNEPDPNAPRRPSAAEIKAMRAEVEGWLKTMARVVQEMTEEEGEAFVEAGNVAKEGRWAQAHQALVVIREALTERRTAKKAANGHSEASPTEAPPSVATPEHTAAEKEAADLTAWIANAVKKCRDLALTNIELATVDKAEKNPDQAAAKAELLKVYKAASARPKPEPPPATRDNPALDSALRSPEEKNADPKLHNEVKAALSDLSRDDLSDPERDLWSDAQLMVEADDWLGAKDKLDELGLAVRRRTVKKPALEKKADGSRSYRLDPADGQTKTAAGEDPKQLAQVADLAEARSRVSNLYVKGRSGPAKEATIQTMQKAGLPNVDAVAKCSDAGKLAELEKQLQAVVGG